MKVMSNVPEVPMMVTDEYKTFNVGDYVRIQYYPSEENMKKGYLYSGGGIIGRVSQINHDRCYIANGYDDREITFDRIFIIKKVDLKENFENTPYINDEEREFWRTYWYTRDGIKRRTAEDSKMLEEFNKKYNK